MEEFILKSDNPDIKRLKKREALWTQGNGYLGVRASFEEGYVNEHRTTLINGVFNCPADEVTELAVLPDAVNFEIEINGERFTMLSGTCENYLAELNMETGEFKRTLGWTSPQGDRVRLSLSRFVSDVKHHIIAQKISLQAISRDMKIKVLSGVNGKITNSGAQHFTNPQKRAYKDKTRGLFAKTIQSEVGVAVHYALSCNLQNESKTVIDRRSIYTEMMVNLQKGETVLYEKISSYASSRDFEYLGKDTVLDEQVIDDGIKYLSEAAKLGYDKLFEESTASFQKFWSNAAIHIEAEEPFYDQAIQFAQYHLYIMANRQDNRLGIGAKALSGEIYRGHSFWDTELFILPYFIFTNPRIARNLLEYRYQLLGSALEKAKEAGFEGAMYPWETAWLDDGEVALQYGDLDLVTGAARHYLMSETEIHVTSAIAYGVWQYYHATGDEDFMQKYGNEMVVLTAYFWTSRVEEKNGRYEICGVIGPDEYKENVDNNAYTNYMAWHNLRFAQQILKNCSDELRERINNLYDIKVVKARIDEVAEKIYLPKAEADGIICQYDNCKKLKKIDITPYKNSKKVNTIFEHFGLSEILKMQVYKQADLVMLFYLMRDLFTKEEMIRNFEYYEKRTLHDSSLSMCIHALVAARLGNKETADDMFFKGCCVDLGENTNNSDDGIHAASIGGIWLMLVFGYAGLELKESGLYLSPILPDGWRKYSFSLSYKGALFFVEVSEEGCSINKLYGNSDKIFINGKKVVF